MAADLAFESHERKSQHEAIVGMVVGSAAIALGTAALVAELWATKGQASEVLPEVKAQFATGLRDVERLSGMITQPSDLLEAGKLVKPDYTQPLAHVRALADLVRDPSDLREADKLLAQTRAPLTDPIFNHPSVAAHDEFVQALESGKLPWPDLSHLTRVEGPSPNIVRFSDFGSRRNLGADGLGLKIEPLQISVPKSMRLGGWRGAVDRLRTMLS